MKFARVEGRPISLDLTNFGAKYQALFNQTDVSGHDLWRAYSHNNFDNQLAQADETLYNSRGWFAEILRDKITTSEGESNGRLKVVYVSHAGLPNQTEHKVAAPVNGYWVPTKDGIFVPKTLVPFETVTDRNEAIARLEKAGIPKEQVSFWYRLDDYKNDEMFVGRSFIPYWVDRGRFRVIADWLPSDVGNDWVAARPAYRASEIVFEVPVLDK